MQFISTRISILEQENKLSIVIFSYRSKLKNVLMVAWMITFSICGVLAISEFRVAADHDRKLFWLVFISFWVYFELVVLKAFLWRLRGKEKIVITKDAVKIKRDITGLERYKEYRVEQIADWKRISRDGSSILNAYENAYWFVGGECIAFDYYGREVRIGSQLSEEETGELLGKIKHYFS
jgi:hypothetical protein